MQNPTVKEVELRVLQGGDHAHTHNSDRLNQIVADEEIADEGTSEQAHGLAELAEQNPTPACGSCRLHHKGLRAGQRLPRGDGYFGARHNEIIQCDGLINKCGDYLNTAR